MSVKKKWVSVGKILREWGVRGELRCFCFNPESRLFSEIKKIFFEENDQHREVVLERARTHGKYWLLKFEGYENPETARELRGLVLAIPREELPKPESDEIYLSDLEGLDVLNPEGKFLGKILGFRRSGESEIMLIGNRLSDAIEIPYESDFVASTSLEKGTVQLKEFAIDLIEINRHDDKV